MENEETTEGICSEAPGVQLVVQRCESARLLIDNANKWVEIGRGLVVYVSFAKGASEVQVMKAAKTVLQVPLVANGAMERRRAVFLPVAVKDYRVESSWCPKPA
jgi:hypothetical protein